MAPRRLMAYPSRSLPLSGKCLIVRVAAKTVRQLMKILGEYDDEEGKARPLWARS
jgi:hypothetical protein